MSSAIHRAKPAETHDIRLYQAAEKLFLTFFKLFSGTRKEGRLYLRGHPQTTDKGAPPLCHPFLQQPASAANAPVGTVASLGRRGEMASAIEWTDETWNPVTGCTRVSPGCDHCYMYALYPRLRGMGVPGYETAPDDVRRCQSA